jgi:hypothetical protein
MTPRIWKYLINNGSGAATRFVAEPDREWAEKELEGDPCLLSYRAKPQIQCSVLHRPAERILQQLRRARAQIPKRKVNRMHNSVVTINDTHWPAYRKENGTLVDLRLFDPNDRSSKPRLMFRPDALRKTGIPEALIEAAAQSNPPGLVLFEDVPQFKGCDDQPTAKAPTP